MHLYAERIWKGDILVANIEELENLDESEIYARRPNAKEIITPKKGDLFVFPIADGTVKLSGGDQVVRKSTLRRDQPERGDELRDDLQPIDTMMDDRDTRNDFWSIEGNYIYRHHLEPRVRLYVSKEESFPIPLRYIDVTRRTLTTLDVLQESRTEYWNIDGDRNLSEPETGFTQFTTLNEKPADGFMWSGERLTKIQATTRPDHLWLFWSGVSKAAQRKEMQQWAIENPKLDNARKVERHLFY